MTALARKLKITIPKTSVEYATWEAIIEQIEIKIKSLRQLPRGRAKSDTLAFYNGLMGEFNGFKDVWRNNVMHTRKSYNAHDALGAFDRVRTFMERLAAKVSE